MAKLFDAIVLNWANDVMTAHIDGRQFGTGTYDGRLGLDGSCGMCGYRQASYFRASAPRKLQTQNDHINHKLLIAKLCDMGLHAHLVRWMAAFMVDRQYW